MLIFRLKLDEQFMNKFFLISLFKFRCGVGEQHDFIQFLVDILPLGFPRNQFKSSGFENVKLYQPKVAAPLF